MLNLVHSIPLYGKKMHTQGSSTSSQWHSDSDGDGKIQFKCHLPHVKQVSAYHSNWFGSATSAVFEPKTSSTSVINLNTSPREEPRSVIQGVTLWTRQDKRTGRTVESLANYGWMMLLLCGAWLWGLSFIDTQQLNAEPAAGAGMYYISYLLLTYIQLATSLVCLFSPELMAFQVKHVKVKKNKTETGFCT